MSALAGFRRGVGAATNQTDKLNLSGARIGRAFGAGLAQAGRHMATFTASAVAAAQRVSSAFSQIGARLGAGLRQSFAYQGQLTGFFRTIFNLGTRTFTTLTRGVAAFARIGSEAFGILSKAFIGAGQGLALLSSGIGKALTSLVAFIPGVNAAAAATVGLIGTIGALAGSAFSIFKGAVTAARAVLLQFAAAAIEMASGILERLSDALGKLADAFLKGAGLIATALIGIGVAGYRMADSVNQGLIDLDRNLKQQGSSLRAYRAEYERFAQFVQANSLLTEGETLGLLNRGMEMGLTPQRAQEATMAAANLSAALGMPIEAAFDQIVKSMSGDLGRLGRVLWSTFQPIQQQLGEEGFKDFLSRGGAIDAINDNWGGASGLDEAAAARAADPLGRVMQTTKRIIQDIGVTILPMVNRWLERLNGWLQTFQGVDWGKWAKNLWNSITTDGLKFLGLIGGGLKDVLTEAFTWGWTFLLNLLPTLRNPLADILISTLRGALGDWVSNRLGIPQTGGRQGEIRRAAAGIAEGNFSTDAEAQALFNQAATDLGSGDLARRQGEDARNWMSRLRSLGPDAQRNIVERINTLANQSSTQVAQQGVAAAVAAANAAADPVGAAQRLATNASVVGGGLLAANDPRNFIPPGGVSQASQAVDFISAHGLNTNADAVGNRAQQLAATIPPDAGDSDRTDARSGSVSGQREEELRLQRERNSHMRVRTADQHAQQAVAMPGIR